MTEFGHIGFRAGGCFIDTWGLGAYEIRASGKVYRFEDSDRFGPALIDIKTGEPTNVMIPSKSPFWRAYERWRNEGRRTVDGKSMGTRRHPIQVLYCVFSDLRIHDADEI